MKAICRVAVLGAGTMGCRIAAHFANAGVPSVLLDVVLPGQPDRDAAARKGIEAALKQRPGGFFTDALAGLVEPGNFEDDLERLRDCDWIIEAVTEDLEIKRALWGRVAGIRRAGTIVSTNTSGIPLARLSEGFDAEFRRHFLGTHFFNPPRYLHLVEVIPGADTGPDVLSLVSDFCERRLGKGVVSAKDTPGFIANRIGFFFGGTVCGLLREDGCSIEEADALTGPLIGLPTSASFRLFDIIGLDVWAFIGKNLYESAPHDPWRERFLPSEFLLKMIERGWLGDKSGQGFYKRVGKEREIHALDWRTFEYRPARKVSFPSAEAVRGVGELPERLRALAAASDRAGAFVWKLLRSHCLYASERVPEISDRIVEIDRAMRWGYAHKLGPFELWDALGFEDTARRMEREGCLLPDCIRRMLSAGVKSFYRTADQGAAPRTEYFDLPRESWRLLEERPGVVELAPLKRARGVVKQNAGASLVDLGDGVLSLEFHGRLNLFGEDQVAMIFAGLEETGRNFAAMVIAGQGESFCAGADWMPVLMAAQNGDWDGLNAAVRRRQQANMAIKYAAKPVVAAPFGRVLGAGCEVVLHAARVQASAELYMGFVEVGLGLIPAGGGCKEMLLRLGDARKTLDLISLGKPSSSAEDARSLGLLRERDGVSMNPERLIGDAKALALSLARGYTPATPEMEIRVPEGGVPASAGRLAAVLSGGKAVSEQGLLDLEREAFLSLCGDPKTQERLRSMLFRK